MVQLVLLDLTQVPVTPTNSSGRALSISPSVSLASIQFSSTRSRKVSVLSPGSPANLNRHTTSGEAASVCQFLVEEENSLSASRRAYSRAYGRWAWNSWKSYVAFIWRYPAVSCLHLDDELSWWTSTATIIRFAEVSYWRRPCTWPSRSALAASCRLLSTSRTLPAFYWSFSVRSPPYSGCCSRRWTLSYLLHHFVYLSSPLLHIRDCARGFSGLPCPFSKPRVDVVRPKCNIWHYSF